MKTENVDSSFDNGFIDDNQESGSQRIEQIVDNEFCYTKEQSIKFFNKCKKILNDAQIKEKIDCLMKYLLENPALMIGFLIFAAILIIPILLFTIFAIINVAIAFTGFIIIEVVFLLIGLTVLCCILFFILSGIVVTGLAFIASVYVTYSSMKLFKRKVQRSM